MKFLGLLLLLALLTGSNAAKCNRLIEGTTMPNSNAGGKYHLFITLFNRTEMVYAYMPNTRYTVTVQADTTGIIPRKFTRFLLSAEPEGPDETVEGGVFDLQDETLTRFADGCPNAVVETSKVPKEEVAVAWTSPSEGSGCILIRATILETPDTWYMDDSNLVLNICQDSKAEADEQGTVLQDCCACEEAKYEVTFEGLWSRNTHPKDFPSKGWLIRFSDVIGASHTVDYRFWKYNGLASNGLQQVAELGSTRKLESELKDESEHIRTIIKARGISYPNVTGKTFAVFRVDRKHHLMSLVSMIDPSPDWIVGVSGLELCLANCSWVEHKELNLYPYDAGTDDGITYLSPDSPTDPHQPITRITSTYPDDPRSPFYDAAGLDMKPLARLSLNRQRLYEKTCENATGETVDPEACRVTPWGPWSTCSVTCGKGSKLRQRRYRDETAAALNKCNASLTDRSMCFGESPHCTNTGRYAGILESDACALDEWGPWSSCTTTCGAGQKTRLRNFRYKQHRKQCKSVPKGPELQQTIDCENDPCGDEDPEEKCPPHRYTQWSMWSPCSSTCGPGVHLRSRLVNKNWSSLGDDDDDVSFEECKVQQAACTANIPTCDFSKEEAEREPRANLSASTRKFKVSLSSVLSYHIPTKEQRTKTKRAQYENLEFRGIQAGSQIVESSENNEPSSDCMVSEWSKWSGCETCRGHAMSTRQILAPARGNGKRCPSKILRRRKCHRMPPCSLQGDSPGRRHYREREMRLENEVSVDCKMTQWSSWSRCSATCGESLQHRTRTVKIQPKGPRGKLCPSLVEFRKCSVIECP